MVIARFDAPYKGMRLISLVSKGTGRSLLVGRKLRRSVIDSE